MSSAAQVIADLEARGLAFEVMECDPELADTARFCEAYGIPLENSANAILVASRKPEGHNAVCVVLATTRLDVNGTVRQKLGVRKVSFASADLTRELTGQEIGGVTIFGLPDGLPVWIDSRVLDRDWVIVGRRFEVGEDQAGSGTVARSPRVRGGRRSGHDRHQLNSETDECFRASELHAERSAGPEPRRWSGRRSLWGAHHEAEQPVQSTQPPTTTTLRRDHHGRLHAWPCRGGVGDHRPSRADGALPAELLVGCRHGPTFSMSDLEQIEPLETADPSGVAEAIDPFLSGEEGASGHRRTGWS